MKTTTNKGYTLIEVLMSLVVVMIVGVGVFSVIKMASTGVVTGSQKIKADNFAQQLLEHVKALSVDDFDSLDAESFGECSYTQIGFLGGTTDFSPGITASMQISNTDLAGRRNVDVSIFTKNFIGEKRETKYFYQIVRGGGVPKGAVIEGFVKTMTFDAVPVERGLADIYLEAPRFNKSGECTSTRTDAAGHYFLTDTAEGSVTVTAARNWGSEPNVAPWVSGYYKDTNGNRKYDTGETYNNSVTVSAVKAGQRNTAVDMFLTPLSSVKWEIKNWQNSPISGDSILYRIGWGSTMGSRDFSKNTDGSGVSFFYNVLPDNRSFYSYDKSAGRTGSTTVPASWTNWSYRGAGWTDSAVDPNPTITVTSTKILNRYSYIKMAVRSQIDESLLAGARVKVGGGDFGPTGADGVIYIYNYSSGDALGTTIEAYKDDGTDYGYYGKTSGKDIYTGKGDESDPGPGPSANRSPENSFTMDLSSAAVLTGITYEQVEETQPPFSSIYLTAAKIDGGTSGSTSNGIGFYKLTKLIPSANPGDKKKINLRLIESATVQVTVKDGSGNELAGAKIYLDGNYQGETIAAGRCDVNVKYFYKDVLKYLSPGSNSENFEIKKNQFKKDSTAIKAEKSGYGSNTVTANDLKPGDSVAKTIVLNINQTCTVKGTIYHTLIDSDTFRLGGIVVKDTRGGGTTTSSGTVPVGSYTLNNVAIVDIGEDGKGKVYLRANPGELSGYYMSDEKCVTGVGPLDIVNGINMVIQIKNEGM